ncbi:hypothetical protein [Deinococcus soli (ex Cha et al. 2016)]|uniref:Uncharacterized protein n=2 Tax=Deinococcus soli (ex Cha et al. 2016) TaxID=1309411 RepID=A0AAE4BPE5_9DEIO|nr:hypothetical protein [Deinococcus soli (ex Cha et al. 2016)]MDR6220129.1 hypothetical protein [Deinococcus soli (ex Cha et al. 2016)]MDR6329984.1 hypothetical protein [Deinococcus soli (ex Cha et al. 2016)]MDR6753385.1 hypothetical protein [Deinococcus soli (ex Cha et al. 2016)]
MHDLYLKDTVDARTAQYEQLRDQLALERQLHAAQPQRLPLRATLATRLRRLADQLDRPAAPSCT